ncbi:DUF4249 family protein [Plebeiibacterium marinum]|uniref:DUF4249 domain-containing protein n=1 Tax=Plebeiibacterium marinum TaxID=2992111 RepID=A0AAE3SIJ8_9BACT|nr:DUF4249 family protein [Plebeiobacterium marinum]MCW3804785.1 DUF4249 domain-containing protein [Plebeiobacterium marinum]
MMIKEKGAIWFFLLLLGFVFSSCEKSLDYQIQNQKSRLVMYSFPMADSAMNLHVSYTTDILSLQNYNKVTGAHATIRINNQIVSESVYSTEEDMMMLEDVVVKRHDTVNVVVSVNDSTVISAETIVPVAAQIISVDTARVMEFNDENTEEEMLKCELGIYDAASIRNYYQVKVEAYTYTEVEGQNSCQVETVDIIEQDKVFLASDYEAVLIADIDYQSTFEDYLFNGQYYTVSFLIPNQYLSPSDGVKRKTLHFYLYSLSPEYYKYVRSVAEQEAFREDPFYEQSNVYSNVSNGLGLVGGLAFDVDSVSVFDLQ